MGHLTSKLDMPLMADTPTINWSRLTHARILIDLYHPKDLLHEIKFKALGASYSQVVEYEWTHVSCAKYGKLGHNSDKCDPNFKPKEKEKKKELAVDSNTLPVQPTPCANPPTTDIPDQDGTGFQQVEARKAPVTTTVALGSSIPSTSPLPILWSANTFELLHTDNECHERPFDKPSPPYEVGLHECPGA